MPGTTRRDRASSLFATQSYVVAFGVLLAAVGARAQTAEELPPPGSPAAAGLLNPFAFPAPTSVPPQVVPLPGTERTPQQQPSITPGWTFVPSISAYEM